MLIHLGCVLCSSFLPSAVFFGQKSVVNVQQQQQRRRRETLKWQIDAVEKA
jgi:hypothetical protein